MLVSHPHNLCYIRVPKTGSNTFLSCLQLANVWFPNPPVNVMHSSAMQRMDAEVEGYRSLAFIRHPMDWLPSFCLWQANASQGKNILCINTRPEIRLEPEDQWDEFLNIIPTPIDWMTDKSGKVIIDDVYRTEDMREVVAGFGYSGKERRDNVTDDYARMEMDFTPRQLAFIEEKFSREFAYY